MVLLKDFIEPEIQMQRERILNIFYKDFILNNITLKRVKSRFKLTDVINCDPNLVQDSKIKRAVSQNYGDNFEFENFSACLFYDILKFRLIKTYDNDIEEFYESKKTGLFKLRLIENNFNYLYNLKFSKLDFNRTFIERKNIGYLNIATNLPGRAIYSNLLSNSEKYYDL